MQIGDADPVTKMLVDIEKMAHAGLVKSRAEGQLEVIRNKKTDKEISDILLKACGSPTYYHMMYQSIGNNMYISMSRVGKSISKTCMAITIKEDDSVTVDYLEHDAIFYKGPLGSTIYNSISTVAIGEDGTHHRGFVRAETTFMAAPEQDSQFVIKVDFKLSKAVPFFIHFTDCQSSSPKARIGSAAAKVFEEMERQWTR
jgi:hypothetical protein